MDKNYLVQQYDNHKTLFLKGSQEYDAKSKTIFHEYINKFDIQGKRVLDMGCADGLDLLILQKQGADVFGIDSSTEMIQEAQKLFSPNKFYTCDFTQTPFPDHYFDIVVSKWAFQTAIDIQSIYKEIIRITNDNARFIFLVTHPIRQFIEKRVSPKDYYQQEIVKSVLFDGALVVEEPSHTFQEYFSPIFFSQFQVLEYAEINDTGTERINGDVYPSFFIIHSAKK
ncbi:class I SAM-dependent methyltransferase [Nostoc sp.]|uniref:class I SAM-dependent methyltransferase n=1 Tax=Nostoc sp. TaxID=1180 RepID=UPI002FF83E1F